MVMERIPVNRTQRSCILFAARQHRKEVTLSFALPAQVLKQAVFVVTRMLGK
jgi:hypothetical protein